MFQYAHILYIAVFVLVAVIYLRRRASHPLPDLDWLNVREGEWFSKQRARIRTVKNGPATVIEAYEKVCDTGECSSSSESVESET